MSTLLYEIGLWFHANRGGTAKLHGRQKHLDNPPSMLGGVVEEVEYVPEVGVQRVRCKFEGWRDMERDERDAAGAWLLRKLG
jgi:hypothetical protein